MPRVTLMILGCVCGKAIAAPGRVVPCASPTSAIVRARATRAGGASSDVFWIIRWCKTCSWSDEWWARSASDVGGAARDERLDLGERGHGHVSGRGHGERTVGGAVGQGALQ